MILSISTKNRFLWLSISILNFTIMMVLELYRKQAVTSYFSGFWIAPFVLGFLGSPPRLKQDGILLVSMGFFLLDVFKLYNLTSKWPFLFFTSGIFFLLIAFYRSYHKRFAA